MLCHQRLLTFAALASQEAVNDMGAEVDTETDTDDEDVHAGDVNGETPPVHEPGHVNAGEKNAHHDEDGAAPAAQRQQRRDEDADQGDPNIPHQLDPHYRVSLPVDVGQRHREAGVSELCLLKE